MIRKLFPYIGKYKIYAILAPIAVIVEVFLEVNIPRIMAKIVDIGIANRNLDYILKMGAMMIIMALASLILGALAARFASVASSGFAKEIRRNMFYKIQDYSFANMDKFPTSSLITRLTTDVTNTQMTFMMMIRMMIRAPIMLIMATFMAVSINARLSLVFMFAIPFMAIALYFIATRAYPKFRAMFKKLDRMNAVIQENLIGIRVVKAFVRGEYEEEKFKDIADQVRETQLRAERTVIWNMPIMQFAMYGCMLAISWFGGNLIISGNMLEGELMGFISYVTQILMKNRKIKLTEKDLHIIDVYSKKNLTDSIPQFNDSSEKLTGHVREMKSVRDEK
jgi:ATP-binding cassette subfamily B multidrug efflux pump